MIPHLSFHLHMNNDELAEQNLRLVARNLAFLFRSVADGMDRIANLKKPKTSRLRSFASVLFYRILFLVSKVSTTLHSLKENSPLFVDKTFDEWIESWGLQTDPLAYDPEFFKGTSYKMQGELVRLKYKYKVTHFKSKTIKQFHDQLKEWNGFGIVVDNMASYYNNIHYPRSDAGITVRPLDGDPNVRFGFPSYALVHVKNPPSAHCIMRGIIMRERQSTKRGYGKKGHKEIQGT